MFRTYEPSRDRLIAVKVFRLDVTPEQAEALADELSRAAEAGLFHPSIVEPVAAGVQGTVAYRAEEYVAAESLDVAMRHYAPAPIDKALPFITQLAGAIDFARAAGIGHGALHLRDIFVTPDEARASGFGVVEALERAGLRAPVRRPYSAPERIAGEKWGTPADVFSLAAIAYELLTGRRAAGTGDQIGPLPRETAGDHADGMRRVLARALDEDPAVRYQTALGFASALEAAARGEQITDAVAQVGAIASASPEPGRGASPEPHRVVSPEPGQGVSPEPGQGVSPEPGRGASPEPGRGASSKPHRVVSPEPGPGVSPESGRGASPEPTPEPARVIAPAIVAREPGPIVAREPERELEPEPEPEPEPQEPSGLVADIDDELHLPVDRTDGERFDDDLTLVDDSTRVDTLRMPSPVVVPPVNATAAAERDEDLRAIPAPEPPRTAMLPFAVTLIIGLLVGFAGGYSVGSRERTAPSSAAKTERGAETAPAGRAGTAPAPAGRAYSEQAVTPPPGTPAPAGAPSSTASAKPTPPAPATGRIVVRSTPSRAGVTVNGVWSGRTTLTLEKQRFGEYEVRVVQRGYATARETFTLSASAPERTLNVRLERTRAAQPPQRTTRATPPATRQPAAPSSAFTGGIYVDSRPRGARVFVDGKEVGTTPLKIPELAIGAHVVRLELADHRTWTTSTRVAAGEETRVSGSLERIR